MANARQRIAANCLLFPLFFVLLAMLGFILYLLGHRLSTMDSEEGQIIIGITLVLATLGVVFVVAMMVASVKKAMALAAV